MYCYPEVVHEAMLLGESQKYQLHENILLLWHRKRSDPDSLRAPTSEEATPTDRDASLRAPTTDEDSSESEEPAPKKRC